MNQIFCKIILVVAISSLCVTAVAGQDFITKWKFTYNASAINFNALTAGGAVSYTWSAAPSGNSGSGSFTKAVAGGVTLSGLTIAAGDIVTLSMQPANLRRFYVPPPSPDRTKLIDVSQWGSVPWSSMAQAFENCSNLNVSATDIPDLSAVTSMANMFLGCSVLTGPANINSWNTATVTDMSNLFHAASVFNQPIGNWNTAAVTNMSYMFNAAFLFNQPIGNWNTAAVTDMSNMFYQAEAFNQDIGTWNTAAVKSMLGMFGSAKKFNRPIGNWNTSSVTNMGYMFYAAKAFNQSLETWDVSGVTNMNNMFSDASLFNQTLNTWDISSLKDASGMFAFASSFNQPLNNWNTANITTMVQMFRAAPAFNQDIGMWKLNPAVHMNGMLDACGMDYCSYSSTLRGWRNNNSTVTGRTLGALWVYYTQKTGAAERNELVTINGWTITGDRIVYNDPFLMPETLSMTALSMCEDNVYVDPGPGNFYNKLIGVDANGNSFNYGGATITITNEFVNTLPGSVTAEDQGLGLGGFYQSHSGQHTLRVSRRMHSIQQPGSYTANGGIRVRVYYDPAEITTIEDGSTLPSGSDPLTKFGWFKSAKHSSQDVVNDMMPTVLQDAVPLTPVATGTESGVSYAEFLLTSFSTIGYFAGTSGTTLPVTFSDFTATIRNGTLLINWSTLSESNVDHFEIEASRDGNSFIKIGSLDSRALNGNSNETLEYRFSKDVSAVAGFLGVSVLLFISGIFSLGRTRRNLTLAAIISFILMAGFVGCNKLDKGISDAGSKIFVRIKQIDKDGKFVYSKVIEVKQR